MMDGRHITPFPGTLGTHPSASKCKCNIGLQWEFTKTEVTTLCVILTKYFF